MSWDFETSVYTKCVWNIWHIYWLLSGRLMSLLLFMSIWVQWPKFTELCIYMFSVWMCGFISKVGYAHTSYEMCIRLKNRIKTIVKYIWVAPTPCYHGTVPYVALMQTPDDITISYTDTHTRWTVDIMQNICTGIASGKARSLFEKEVSQKVALWEIPNDEPKRWFVVQIVPPSTRPQWIRDTFHTQSVHLARHIQVYLPSIMIPHMHKRFTV